MAGARWAISLFLCIDGLRKRSSYLVEPPFLATKALSLYAWVVGWSLAESLDYSKKVTCREKNSAVG